MYKNKALIDRILNTPSVNDNNVMMYRKAVSLVEQYNIIARDKGLPTKKVPIYNDSVNCTLMRKLLGNILRDLDKVKNIKEENGGGEDTAPNEEKILRNVTFVSDQVTDGIWDYTIIPGTDTIKVAINNEFFEEFNEEIATLGYDAMPYEKLIDKENKEYQTVSYNNIFNGISSPRSNVSTIIIDNWTNMNVTDMFNMFLYADQIVSITLGTNFNTFNVTDMSYMFSSCSALESIDLSTFNTFNVTDMSYMFDGCSSLQSVTLGINFNPTNTTNIFIHCILLKSMTLYQSAESIIEELPSGTWKINGTDNTITVTQGLSAEWSSSQPDNWDTVPITLIYQSSQ